MGFWETAGKAAGAMNKRLQEEAEKRDCEMGRARKKAAKLSDRQLYERFQSAHGYKKAGYSQELQRRGYGDFT